MSSGRDAPPCGSGEGAQRDGDLAGEPGVRLEQGEVRGQRAPLGRGDDRTEQERRQRRSAHAGALGLAESAGLTVLASGDPEALAACRPVFAALSARVQALGEAEEAAYLKLVHSLIVGVYSAMIGEALAFGQKGGLPLAAIVDVLEAGPLGSRQLTLKAPILRERRFDAPPSDIDAAAKDVDLILDAARADRAPLPLTSAVRQLMAAA